MPARTIVCIISSILGAITLVVGLVLSIVVKEKGIGMATIFGLTMLSFNGVFTGFGIRELYGFLEQPEKWGKTGTAVLCGLSTAIFGLAAYAGFFWLVLADGPNATKRLPEGALALFGVGMSVATGGMMFMINKPNEA